MIEIAECPKSPYFQTARMPKSPDQKARQKARMPKSPDAKKPGCQKARMPKSPSHFVKMPARESDDGQLFSSVPIPATRLDGAAPHPEQHRYRRLELLQVACPVRLRLGRRGHSRFPPTTQIALPRARLPLPSNLTRCPHTENAFGGRNWGKKMPEIEILAK
jgi:hypothetical protein